MSAAPPRPRAELPAQTACRLAAIALIAVVLAAYASSFAGAFVFDDLPAIVDNPSLQPGASWADVLRPPAASTVSGRPVLNATFALNRALAGDAPWSFHALNLLIHLGAGAFLFGVVRRTLARRGLAAETPALFIAALWLLHPLQTESVTYVVQRAESLASCFYLGAFYGFIRALDERASRSWAALTLLFALLAVGTKEIAVTLPCALLLYDRVFVAGTLASALRLRRWLYAGLAATWLPLAGLVASTQGRSGSAGFGTTASVVDYASTQLHAVAHYLRLAAFPHPLVFDYGDTLLKWDWPLAGHAAICAVLLVATARAWFTRPALGFLGAVFFLLLAPSSSFVPVTSQTIAEHRMYLPLAPAIAAVVLALHALLGRRALPAGIVAAGALGIVTFHRNLDYRSPRALWTDTVAKRPENARAHDWLGLAALEERAPEVAVVALRRAVSLAPQRAKYRNNLGAALGQLGRFEEAHEAFESALRLDPSSAEARHNVAQAETRLALTLIQAGRAAEALPHLRRAADLEPDNPATRENLAIIERELARAGR